VKTEELQFAQLCIVAKYDFKGNLQIFSKCLQEQLCYQHYPWDSISL